MAETQLSQLPVPRVLPAKNSHVFLPHQAPGTQSISSGEPEPTAPQMFWMERRHGMERGCTGAEHRIQPSPGIRLFLAIPPPLQASVLLEGDNITNHWACWELLVRWCMRKKLENYPDVGNDGDHSKARWHLLSAAMRRAAYCVFNGQYLI